MDSKIAETTNGQTVLMSLPSIVNEQTLFTKIYNPQIQNIKIDFTKVEYFSSSGIKNWINWVQHISSNYPNIQIELHDVTSPFIRHISVITEMMSPKMFVTGFLCNYFCDECQNEITTHVDNIQNYQVKEHIPCDKCKAQMELEIAVESYEILVNHAPKWIS